MSRVYTISSWVLLTVALAACTDGRPIKALQLTSTTPAPSTSLLWATDIQFKVNGEVKSTYADQMMMFGGSLFMTGRPFGFTRMEIAQDMENPRKTFAMSEQIDTFSPIGRWDQESYSSGGLAIQGTTAFMSGTKGTSVVTIADTAHPVELQRYPAPQPNSDIIPSDAAYTYTAMLTHPTKKILYGFTAQDYLYTWDLSAGRLNSLGKAAYGANGQAVCCAMGATIFNNQVFVGFRDRLVFYSIGSSGLLTKAGETTVLNVTNVFATSRLLYVQHEPTYSSTGAGYSTRPQGIYVFNASGQQVAFFAAGSPKRFAVSNDDSHFYANVDGTAVKIYRIRWAQ